MKRSTLSLSLFTLCLAAGPARAEVGVVLDEYGRLVRLNLVTGNSKSAVWTKVSSLAENQLLNPLGDRLRDLAPAPTIIAMPMDDPTRLHGVVGDRNRTPSGQEDPTEDSAKERTAVVVWPRREINDYELVYSVWDPKAARWRAPAYVLRSPLDGNDLEPWLFAREGRLYLLWRNSAVRPALLVRGKMVVSGHTPDVLWDAPIELLPGTLIDGLDLTGLAGTPQPGGPVGGMGTQG